LVFAGCSQYLALRMNLPKQFTRVYSSLFMKGYVKEQLPNSSNGMNLQEHYPLLFLLIEHFCIVTFICIESTST